jgi:hypothetical protein
MSRIELIQIIHLPRFDEEDNYLYVAYRREMEIDITPHYDMSFNIGKFNFRLADIHYDMENRLLTCIITDKIANSEKDLSKIIKELEEIGFKKYASELEDN